MRGSKIVSSEIELCILVFSVSVPCSACLTRSFGQHWQFREYSVQYEKDCSVERCFVLYWDDKDVKKICVGCESLEQAVPTPELVPLARVVCSLNTSRMPKTILGVRSCLVRVLEDNRADGRRFVVYQGFDEEVLFRCVLQADQDVFGTVSVTTLVEYLRHGLKSAVFEDWTEDKVVLRKCIRQGSVGYADYRSLLTDVIDLWPTIRPFIRCTGHPDAKTKTDTVSIGFFSTFDFLFSLSPSVSWYCIVVVL